MTADANPVAGVTPVTTLLRFAPYTAQWKPSLTQRSNMGAILLIGDKPLILSSYSAVFTAIGRQVKVCSAAERIASQLRNNRIDLIVICFTVTDRSRRSILSDAFACSLRPQILQVVTPDESPHLAFGADAYVSAIDPVALLARARTMLGSQGLHDSAQIEHSCSHT